MIIGITGLAGSGKSTLAAFLVERHGFTRLRFASTLKAMLATLLREMAVDETRIARMIDGDLKEVPAPELCGHTPRHAMQTLGTEWGRQHVAETIWTDALMRRVEAERGDVVIDDVRFPNEGRAIWLAHGIVARVYRPGLIQGAHASEAGDVVHDVQVVNDSTLDALALGAETLVSAARHLCLAAR